MTSRPSVTLDILEDEASTARTGADLLAGWLTELVRSNGHASIALSGGRTPWQMLTSLAGRDLPWTAITIYQVDERIAPEGSDDRNLTHLAAALSAVPARIEAMDVSGDPDDGARHYAEHLPDHLDIVHLGLGPDGHTASLVPGDPVLEVTDRRVAVTGRPYQGVRRMTLTYPALAAATRRLWLVTGAEKADALVSLLDADPGIPAGPVIAPGDTVLVDRSASTLVTDDPDRATAAAHQSESTTPRTLP